MKRVLVLAAFLWVIGPVPTIHAQDFFGTGIQTTGSVTLERPAERMKMRVDLVAKSTKDLPDALAKLKAQRAKAEKTMDSLGVIKDSIKYGEPTVDDSVDDSQRQMEMMMRQRMMQQRGKKPKKEVLTKPVRVMVRLSAEWSVKPGDSILQLVETKKLQEAIKNADLAGLKESEEQTPEEAEIAEEMEEPVMRWGGRNERKPGEPEFVFAASIPADEHGKALAEAFRKAKAEAAELAKAAQAELGPLQRLQSSGGLDSDDSEAFQQLYNSGYGQRYRDPDDGDKPREAVGVSPGALKYRVMVSTSFAIK